MRFSGTSKLIMSATAAATQSAAQALGHRNQARRPAASAARDGTARSSVKILSEPFGSVA